VPAGAAMDPCSTHWKAVERPCRTLCMALLPKAELSKSLHVGSVRYQA
jgi:hypothetical protein